MIHLRIPDSVLSTDQHGSFRKFNFYINGAFHCAVRFSKLLRFHESLEKDRGLNDVLPPFPTKKLFDLNAKQLEERRDHLERYFSAAIRIDEPEISALLAEFFFQCQQEGVDPSDVAPCGSSLSVYIFTLDGTKVELTVDLQDNTSAVVKKFAQKIGLRHSSAPYFGVFLVKRGIGKLYSLVRWLQDFESPVISQFLAEKATAESHKLIVRKSFWDLSVESQLLMDQNAANLLFTQAVSDVDLGLMYVSDKVRNALEAFRKKSLVLEYLKLCEAQNFYGFVHFDRCKSDFPRKDSSVNISLGNMLMVFQYENLTKVEDEPSSSSIKLSTTFKVTRIRTWKLVRAKDKEVNNLYLTFEYLVTSDQMDWISIYSRQAVLISLCLKSMVSAAARQYCPEEICDGEVQSVPSTVEPAVYESFKEINVKKNFELPRPSAVAQETSSAITDEDL